LVMVYRRLVLAWLLVVGLSAPALAEETKECLGGILPEGKGVQFCFEPKIDDNWCYAYSAIGETGLMIADFIIEHCRSGKYRRERVQIYLYDRSDSESIKNSARLLGVLFGMPRKWKFLSGYRIAARRGRNRRMMTILPFQDGRYFAVIRHRRHTSRQAIRAAIKFFKQLEIRYSEINQ